jgi:histidinol-phosphate phosphatase family protein
MPPTATTVVVPTVGRPSLAVLLRALAAAVGPPPEAVIVVDDRRAGEPLEATLSGIDLPGLTVVRSGGGGPARARNVGWRRARTEWVSFLDDDVLPDADWARKLAADLAELGSEVAGSQGLVRVPLPAYRRPTDWERGTAGLATARWITADMTYRRSALSAVGGFDERFPRAFREDSDLALRVLATGSRLVTGERWVSHPVRPADFLASVRQQAGNADDVLMRRLHGRSWRQACGAGRGRRRRHVAVTAGAVSSATLLVAGRPKLAGAAAVASLAGVAEFAAARISPGPRSADEIARMAVTSILIPFAATWHTLRGEWRHRRAGPWRGAPDLVLLDRDGTLVHDVAYNTDPTLVRPVDGAADALARLRSAGIRTGVVSNQSGVAKGLITADQLAAVNARVDELLGPFDAWEICPHGPDDGCGCRKPAPGMVKHACRELDVEPSRTVVVGDIGTDVEAAEAAGATGVLVPTAATARPEVEAASLRCRDLQTAVDLLLAGDW